MSSLRARVKNGRLVLDEPTELPEGTEIDLVFDMSLEPSALDAAELSRRLDEVDAGTAELVDWSTVQKRLRRLRR